MKCPNHLRTEAAGYCCVCGTFFCETCLSRHEGQTYCPKHFKPIAQKLAQESKREQTRKRHGRQKLVVRYTDGRVLIGIALSLNPRDSGFTLQKVDKSGGALDEAIKVRFSELKALFNVKSFDGKFDKKEQFQEYTPGGTALVVKFKDGEIVEGTTLHAYDPDDVRFYLIPEDASSNNINILVEAASVERVFTPEEYADRKETEKLQKTETPEAVVEETALGQEESMGDFYFETRSYPSAFEQYQMALAKHPKSPRLKRKVVVSAVNVGILYIKKREYPNALACMETALKYDPENVHAKKKAKQLRHIIDKTQRRMRAYARESEAGKTTQTGEEKGGQ